MNTRTPAARACSASSGCAIALPVSAPSDRSTSEPTVAPSSSRSPRAAATASRICVPFASGGVDASAAWISASLVVSGSTTLDRALNVTTAIAWFSPRVSANARAASSAPSIASPRMLSLASITSTTANSPAPAADAGRTVSPSTGSPFSRTVTSSGSSATGSGSESTNARSGKRAPPSSRSGRSVAAVAALTSAAAAATTAASASRRRTALTGRSPERAPRRAAGGRRRDPPAAPRRASRTCAGTSVAGRSSAGCRSRRGPR